MFTKTCIFILQIFACCLAFAIDLSKENTAYWYDQSADVRVRMRAARSETSLSIFVKLDRKNDFPINFSLKLQDGYEDANHIESSFTIDTLFQEGRNLFLQFTLPLPRKPLVVLTVKEGIIEYHFALGIQNTPAYYPIDENNLPIVTPWFAGKVRWRFLAGDEKLIVFQYGGNFPAADPPMGNMGEASPRLSVDNIYTQWPEEMSVSPGTFFLTQQDTLSNEAITLIYTPDYFPLTKQIDDLIGPTIYIARNSEMNDMLTASNPKRTFDQFWLRLFASEQETRIAIRTYYRKVQQANAYFTNYKVGWKNDPGMIYIVFGKPKAVYRYNAREIWVYDGLVFEFRIISHLFTPEMMILRRKQEYQREWISHVREIRGNR